MADTTRKIIRGIVNSRGFTITSAITQWDYGWQFIPEIEDLPATYRLDFSNEEKHGTALPVYCDSEGAEVPTELIDTGKDVWVWYVAIGDGYGITEYKWRIPNHCKPSGDGETPTPSQQSSIDQLIVRSNEAVTSAEQSASDADASAQSASADADRAEEARTDAQNFATQAETSADNASASASQASASATASANSASQSAQIKADVEDMVDDAQGYANASAQSASASANSATSAQGYAQSASASAQSASGYASDAQTSAQTAIAKAQDASTSAQTASQKATESAQTASQALTYKTDAESAKTASQTAQGLAESARDLAQGYAEDAQGYANDAQASAESISASASQIAQNTADILKAFPTDTASGAVASFTDGADDIPLKSLVIDINPVQDTSSGDPSPENICPISGWTGCEVSATGYNVWDEQWENGGYAYGNPSPDSLRIRSKNYIPVKPNTTYYFNKGVNNGNMWVFFYDRNKACLNPTINGNNVGNSAVTTPDKCYYIRFFLSAQTEYQHDVAINYPSTDHDYHPYTGQSIPIDWQTDAGTVYGGKLDVLSGKLIVTMLSVTIDSSKIVRDSATRYRVGKSNIGDFLYIGDSAMNKFKKRTSSDGYSASGTFFTDANNLQMNAYRAFDTKAEFIEEYGELQFVFTLATPIEIQLTPHQVNSLLGVNNIWADSGDTTAVYRADTKLFIERLTAPDSADMIADANIQSGKYFMVGNSLYKATANIASGSAIIVGTNAVRKSLSEALNEINA